MEAFFCTALKCSAHADMIKIAPLCSQLFVRALLCPAGFRRYDRICETLMHELAHMVHSEHDNAFKTLNSEVSGHMRRAKCIPWIPMSGLS